MPSTRHLSKLILSKGIKLDRDYKQVLSYTEANMISLMSDNAHLVSMKSDYNFIKERGSIKVQETYGNCLKANYMAFQNTDYSGKWFFAFIDDVKYLSDYATEIYYTIDIWTTWFDYWNPKNCYIIRQHATTDSVGDNLIPEKLEHGEYIQNSVYLESLFGTPCYLLVTKTLIEAATPTTNYINMGGTIMNGQVYYSPSISRLAYLVEHIKDNNPDNEVLYAYCVPNVLIPSTSYDEYGQLSSWTTPYNYDRKALSRPTSIDGYTPVNKKLLTYPYVYCLFSNMAGNSNVLRFEESGHLSGTTGLEDGAIYVKYWGVPSIGGSVVAIPRYYKESTLNINYSLVLGKFPTLGWSEDAYTNWLTQNSVNNTVRKGIAGAQIIGGAGGMLLGAGLMASGVGALAGASLLTGGASMLVSGGTNAAEVAMDYYEHSIEPDSYQGNTNAGDIMMATGQMGFAFYSMSIRKKYAQIIDRYFTRFGYAQNDIQYPNMLHRANYNYIQISKDSKAAYGNDHNNISIPADVLDNINNIFRVGVTVWNNHANFGDYSVANGITS